MKLFDSNAFILPTYVLNAVPIPYIKVKCKIMNLTSTSSIFLKNVSVNKLKISKNV